MSGSGVTLGDALDFVRVEADGADEVDRLLMAAEDHVARYLNRPFPWTDDDGNEIETPASVKHAILMLTADFYDHRTATVEGVRVRDNPTVARLLDLYREGIGV